MPSADLAYVTPKVLAWAIDRAGANTAKLARSLGVEQEQVDAWAQGESHPPFSKALQLATILRIPFGYLFLSDPPRTEIPLPDLRTLPNEELREPSVDFLELLYEVIAKQNWYRDFLEEQGAKRPTFVSKYTSSDSAIEVAADIRQTLSMSNGVRSNARAWSDYLRLLSGSAEDAGVMVMRSGVVGNNTSRPLSAREFQGFAIIDPVAPLVFINGQDFESAKIFTLLHELAHIWVGKSGISNPDETQVSTNNTPPIELFCNSIAAEALVPQAEFLNRWRSPVTSERIQQLAQHFFVSTLVILRRAKELDQINTSQFFTLLEQERKKRTKEKPSGGDYYRNVKARHGSNFTEAVLQDVRQGKTGYRDAARLLDVKVRALEKMVERSD